MPDVFISYKREERGRCERIAEKLKALGLDVWFDSRLESSNSFDREIEQNVNAAKAVLVLWSPKSVDSDWVRAEAGIGKEQNKLVAAELAPCKLPIAFKNTHFETLHDVNFPDSDPAWLKIIGRIARLTERKELAFFASAIEALEPKKTAPNWVMGLAGLLLGAVLGGAGGFMLGGRNAAPLAAAGPDAPLTQLQAAAGMVGKWKDEFGDCDGGATLVSLSASGDLVLELGGAREEMSPGALTGDWLATSSGKLFLRDGETLKIKASANDEPSVLTECPQ